MQADEWMNGLACLDLRGLAHEVGQRLVEGSKTYHDGLADLEELQDQLNYLYFGLSFDASEKDLDNAYRKLAKKMHPDKNGGTEEAKRKFQHMKERYEALKKRIREHKGEVDSLSEPEAEATTQSIQDAVQANGINWHAAFRGLWPEEVQEEQCQKKAKMEEPEAKEEQSNCSSYDPKDKASMIEHVSRMARQLQGISEQMSILQKDLDQTRAYLTELSGS